MSSPPEPKGPEPRGKAPWRKALTLTATFFVVIIGAVSGVAQLGVFPADVARVLLTVVILAGLLYFVIHFWQFYFVEKVRQLRTQLAAEAEKLTLERSGHQRYLEAIERISDREKPLYSETLEVTVWIGKDDDSDRIVEKRVTTPEPLVTHRTIRPIVPTDHEQIVRLDEIGFRVQRASGRITYLPLREQINRLRVWLVFDPALTTRTEWQVEYHPRGLWRPLRERGWDQLGWDDRLPTANGTPSAFASFKVIFKFPKSDQPPAVRERQGYGRVAEPAMDDAENWEVVWRDERPAGRHYVWDLAHGPETRGGRGPAGKIEA